jgi:hypothetical protein
VPEFKRVMSTTNRVLKMLCTELVLKEGVTVLQPEKFVWVEVVTDSMDTTVGGLRATNVGGLRATTNDSYEWFCENFMECVIPTTQWKMEATHKRISEYVTAPLEAFAVLVYKNGFAKWNEEFPTNDDVSAATNGVSESSSLTAGSRGHSFLFTGDSKGSRRYEGWNAVGMKFYNNVLSLIKTQRDQIGCPFERKLLDRLKNRPRGGRRGGSANEAPRVDNGLDELMASVFAV